MVKNLPGMKKTQVGSLNREDPLEKGMATHSRFLAWRITWTEAPGKLQSMGSQRVRQDLATEQQQNLYIRCVDVDVSLDMQVEICTGCEVCEFGTERDLEWGRRLRSHWHTTGF